MEYIKGFFVRLMLVILSIILTLIGLTMIVPLLLWLFAEFNYIDWSIELVTDLYYKLS